MKTFKVIETQIFDNTVSDENGKIQLSEISVGVTVEIEGKNYTLDFQTTTTNDYGAYSSRLASYDGNSDHETLASKFEDEDQFFQFLDQIKEDADAEKVWSDYVSEKYTLNDESFGGMDANSEVNEARLKK